MKILEKSSFYKSIEKKFSEYCEKAKEIKPDSDYDFFLENVCKKIEVIFPDFKEYKVHFKQFEKVDKDLSFCDNKNIYFSSEKLKDELNQEWEFWIFIKLLKLLEIKIENAFESFNKLFSKEKK